MSMMHFEPFRSLRYLDRFTSQLLSGTQVPHAMPMDVWREGQTYHVALDLPGVEADYSNGVLHLTIPVHQAAQPRRISVSVSSRDEGVQPRVIEGDPRSGEAG